MESRRRPIVSCETCRSRKVKVRLYSPPIRIATITYHQCIKPDSEPCQRCQRLGKECVTTGEKYERPYYHTSKEKYELIAKVIQHFVPSATLDTRDCVRLLIPLINIPKVQALHLWERLLMPTHKISCYHEILRPVWLTRRRWWCNAWWCHEYTS